MSDKEINKPHDQVERNNQGDRTSESTSKDSVISGDRKDHQALHQEASKAGHTFDTFSDNNHDQSFKAIQPASDTFGIDFGDGTIETSKGKVTKASEQLIAANLTPDSQIRSKSFEPNPAEVRATNAPKDSIAWGEDKMIPRVTMPSPGDKVTFPYRGFEDQLLSRCSEKNPQAWSQAFRAFPELSKYLSLDIGTNLMKAIVRNELSNYDLKDRLGDSIANLGFLDSSETLGYSQITPTGVREFATRYPQFKDFISKHHSGQNAEADSLRDPECIPMIVAAKLQSEVDFYQNADDKLHPGQRIPINARTLAYAYNADVYYNPNSTENPDFHCLAIPKAKQFENLRGYAKAYPTGDQRVLNLSQHLKNIEDQMNLVP